MKKKKKKLKLDNIDYIKCRIKNILNRIQVENK